jgi:hypothetical protein
MPALHRHRNALAHAAETLRALSRRAVLLETSPANGGAGLPRSRINTASAALATCDRDQTLNPNLLDRPARVSACPQ